MKWNFSFKSENAVYLLFIAILIGAATGYLAVGFRFLLMYATELCWKHPSDILSTVEDMKWYFVILIPVIGGILVGPLVTFLAPETRGTGVPEVIEAAAMREGTIRHRTTVCKIISSVISIGSGASVGREGPIVHIGSSVGSSIAQVLKLRPEWRRIFLACGAASGIAATFNAPMAGVLFAIEIILKDFEISYIGHIVISAVTATVISHHFLGNLPAFDIPQYQMVSYLEIPLYLILGILAGFVSVIFIKLLSSVENVFDRLNVPVYLRPAVGGFLVGIIAIRYPHILGVGYESVNLVLTANIALNTMIIVIILKILATSFSVGSGFSGGIFAPSLFSGAMLGGIFGTVSLMIFPDIVAPSQAYGLIGMGAVVSGTTLAPITAILTIFELTYNYNIILPLMTSCIASLVIVNKFCGHSIYEMKLLKKGINIVRGHDINILRGMMVNDFMEREYEYIYETSRLRELIAKIQESNYPHFPVLDKQGNLVGMFTLRDLKHCLPEIEDLGELTIAADIMTKNVYCITPDDNLATAFEIFEGKQISMLPVVDANDRNKITGVLKKNNVILAYNQKVLRARTFGFGKITGRS
ncbi:MAG: chloride channel protein [Syntrophales bacterium]|nr:chloride channel protein [Syntrophales bacterium]